MSRPDLALLALRYAAGELVGPDAAAFEARLATDTAARDVLGEAVRLSAAVSGVPAPVPKAGTLAALRDRLFPTPLTRLFPVKSYRGHPIVWIGLGGLAAGLLTFTLVNSDDPVTRRVELPRCVPAVEVPPVANPSTETAPSASPVARIGPALPTPMPQPHANAPAELPVETKKG